MRISRAPLLLAATSALFLGLGGCVYDGYYDDRYYGYEDGYYYDGYYDGYYGPYAGGYWAIDGFFYYWFRDRYYRDDHRHFSRDHFPGAQRFRGDRDGPSRQPQHGYRQSPGQQLPPAAHPPRQRPPRSVQHPPSSGH